MRDRLTQTTQADFICRSCSSVQTSPAVTAGRCHKLRQLFLLKKPPRNPWFLQVVCKNVLMLALPYRCMFSLHIAPWLPLQNVYQTRQAIGSHACLPSEEMGPGEGGGADSQELEYSGGQKDQRLCEPPCLQYYFPYSPSHGVSTADLELASTSRARGSTNVT